MPGLPSRWLEKAQKWCRQALSPHVVLDYVTAVYKDIPA